MPAIQRNGMYWQQDNASIHTAKNVASFFENLGITVLPWPADSPDLNCIENVWSMLKDYVNKYFAHLEDQGESQQARAASWYAIEQAWIALDHKVINACIISMENVWKQSF